MKKREAKTAKDIKKSWRISFKEQSRRDKRDDSPKRSQQQR
jgi:hypothetical protein